MTIVAKPADIKSAAQSVGIPLTNAEVTNLLKGQQVSLDKLTLYEYARLLMKIKAAKTTVIREMGKRSRNQGTQKKMDPPPQVLPFSPGDFNGFHISGGSGIGIGYVGFPVKCWDTDGHRCCLYVGLLSIWVSCEPIT